MWALLHWAASLGLPSLHIFGDSSMIINWALGKAALTCLALDYWCEAIRKMIPNFLKLDFQHIYREQNQCADGLSKEALLLDPGLCHISAFFYGSVYEISEFMFF